MAKRYTDTEKWKKHFMRGLGAPYKLLWLYILDECNHAGIWHVEIDVAKARIGEEITEKQAIEQFKERIYVFDNGEKWFIPDFIAFQYGGELNEKNNAHRSVIEILRKYDLLKFISAPHEPLTSPSRGHKDKDKDISYNKSKEKEEDKKEEGSFTDTSTKIANKKVSDKELDVISGSKIALKKEKFKKQLKPFLEKYGKDMLNEFYLYWSEANKSQTKLRWEMEKTWELPRRLARWANNQKFTRIDLQKGGLPNYWTKDLEKKIPSDRLSEWWSLLRANGWKPKKNDRGEIVEWIKT